MRGSMSALTGRAAPNSTHDVVRVKTVGMDGSRQLGPRRQGSGTAILPPPGAVRAAVVLVGGHEGVAEVAVEPSRERGPLWPYAEMEQ